MPKKTKRQKILAELHRKLKSPAITEPQFVKSQNISLTTSSFTPAMPIFHISDKIVSKPKTTESLLDYSYVRHDLIRITIFTLFAFIFQGMLYFLLQRH